VGKTVFQRHYLAQITYSILPYLAAVLERYTSIAVWWVALLKQRTHTNRCNHFPSPPQTLAVGNLPQILATVKQKLFRQVFDQQLSPMYVIWNSNKSAVILSKPKVIEYKQSMG